MMNLTESTGAGEKLQSISIQRGQKVMSLMDGLEPTKEMVSFLKGLSPMIMQNGLGQTIAFMQSKRDKHGQLLAVLEKVMSASNGLMDKILNAEKCDILHIAGARKDVESFIKNTGYPEHQ